MKYQNVFYFSHINSVGGCESFFYYLAKTYKNMVVYYKEGNPEQIKRLAELIEVKKYKENEKIVCDNFFCCYCPDILDHVEAKMYAHLIHCDYANVWFPPITNPKFNKYIAVSKIAGDSFKQITGIDYELIYNPIKIEKPKVEKKNDNVLHLVSATRLTREKGLKRMQKLCYLLNEAGINYEWTIFTNRRREAVGQNTIYEEPRLDIIDEIAKADFLVQLSDCEAYCYSIVEALCCGVPVIATDLPVLKELGVKHGENAVICDFNMNNVDTELIKKGIKPFVFEPPKSEWGKYLNNDTKYNPNDIIKVRTTRRYYDLELGQLDKGKEYEMTKARASYLEAKGLVNVL